MRKPAGSIKKFLAFLVLPKYKNDKLHNIVLAVSVKNFSASKSDLHKDTEASDTVTVLLLTLLLFFIQFVHSGTKRAMDKERSSVLDLVASQFNIKMFLIQPKQY